MDMRNTLTLFRGKKPVRETLARINHPLTWRGLVVVPTTFGQFPIGFRFHRPGQGIINLEPGTVIDLPVGGTLRVLSFYPDAARAGEGRIVRTGHQIGNPALELEIVNPYQEPWHGWYFLREALPFPLIEAGLRIWPTEPAYKFVSVFTINRDPGAGLAMAGGILIFAGVLLAMVSYYYKRSRGDRPQVG